jgi:hypothetical protein
MLEQPYGRLFGKELLMKETNAKVVTEKIWAAIELLNETISHVHETEPTDIYLVYRDSVTEAWEILISKLLNPLYRQHRQLMPEDLGLTQAYLDAPDDSGL